MIRKARRIPAGILAAVLALGLCACGSRGTDMKEPETGQETVQSETEPETVVTEPMTEETEPSTQPPTEPEPEEYVITFAGDCTLGSTQSLSYAGLGFPKTVGEDYGHPFRNVQQWFSEDDLTLVNLEGPLVDGGFPTPNKKFNFRGPTDYVQILTQGSVEAVSLANNHSADYGVNGYQSTMDTLDSAGIAYAGCDSIALVTVGEDFQVGIVATMFNKLDEATIVERIRSLKEEGADFVIFAVHWGTEYDYSPASTQKNLAHAAIDAGADVVWGHHPHVLQPIEYYGSGVIFYSLGNFSFGGNTAPRDFDTAFTQVRVTRSAGEKAVLSGVDVYPACISSEPKVNNYQPTPYEVGTAEYNRVLEKLNWQQS